jgi:hypothetical protein
MALLLTFLTLQLFDAGTTLVFLARGVAEGNPLIGAMLRLSPHPAFALVAVKAAAFALALLAWKGRRTALLRRANVFFAVCVVWNLAAIAAA